MTIRPDDRDALPNPRTLSGALPGVRLEVRVAAVQSPLRAGLEELGLDVWRAGKADQANEAVLVEQGSLRATDADSAFLVIGLKGSIAGLRFAIESGASGYLAAPFDFPALGFAICAAARQARELKTYTQRMAELSKSTVTHQAVNTAVGILMERLKLPRAEAYGRLRLYAKVEKRKMPDLSAEIVAMTENLGRTLRGINKRPEDI